MLEVGNALRRDCRGVMMEYLSAPRVNDANKTGFDSRKRLQLGQ